ncbi:ARM repeat-containing protein [Hysterangium stoloniferum]|nr:ARM repeat-containing protein [Hysterangium stoloniferum]
MLSPNFPVYTYFILFYFTPAVSDPLSASPPPIDSPVRDSQLSPSHSPSFPDAILQPTSQLPASSSLSSPPLQDPSHPNPEYFPDSLPITEPSVEVYVEDENLSSVERIYLLSRSKNPLHRVFISRSLHAFLPGVSPLEAVEYVLPLLNMLAVDEEDIVKEALAAELVSIMWWFFQNCRIVEDDSLEAQGNPPLLPVQSFTPILGSLLIDHNSLIGGPARFAVVEILNRLHAANDTGEDDQLFGIRERQILEQEIIHQVIIGMGRLDISDETCPSPVFRAGGTSTPQSPSSPTNSLPMTPNVILDLPASSDYPHESSEVYQQQTLSITARPIPDASPSPPIQELPLAWLTVEGKSGQDVHDNEQAAIGRLSSMSLIATVTANGMLNSDIIRAFADEVAYIGSDPLFWVRREASFAVGALAKVVPTEVLSFSLLPLFETLVQDEVWRVRHSAIFALPGVLGRLTPQHRRSLALKTVTTLATDSALEVRSGVLEVLGEVIYTFHEDGEGVPTELVDLFVGRENLAEESEHTIQSEPQNPDRSSFPAVKKSTTSGFFRDPARTLITSFNYPAVALSLGPQRWNEIRDYYLVLSRDPNVRVRRTVAAGLGEMARILGKNLAQRDLLEVWDDMVHDGDDGVTRLKALGGVSQFIEALEGQARDDVVGELVELWERWLTGWRERECLTRALPQLGRLAEGQGAVIRTLMLKSLVDTVAAVREAAIATFSDVLQAFERRPNIVEGLLDDLSSLAHADLCRRRTTYVACCGAVIAGPNGKLKSLGDDFWTHISQLSQDHMLDVRIGVSRLVGVICDKFYPDILSRPPHILEVIQRLVEDPSRDVRDFIAFSLTTDVLRTPQPNTPPLSFATFSRPPSIVPNRNNAVTETTVVPLDAEDVTVTGRIVPPDTSDSSDSEHVRSAGRPSVLTQSSGDGLRDSFLGEIGLHPNQY